MTTPETTLISLRYSLYSSPCSSSRRDRASSFSLSNYWQIPQLCTVWRSKADFYIAWKRRNRKEMRMKLFAHRNEGPNILNSRFCLHYLPRASYRMMQSTPAMIAIPARCRLPFCNVYDQLRLLRHRKPVDQWKMSGQYRWPSALFWSENWGNLDLSVIIRGRLVCINVSNRIWLSYFLRSGI